MPYKLVCFRDANHAQVLIDYLLSQHINCELQVQSLANAEDGEAVASDKRDDALQYCIVLAQDSDTAKAQTILNHFIDAPHDPRYQAASWDNPKVTKLAAKRGSKGGASGSAIVEQLREFPLVTGVLALCILIYMAMPLPEAGMWIYSHLFIAPLNELMVTMEWWRILTPAFIHFSLMHIAFNLMWWWILGTQIEARMGKSTLLLLLLSIGIASNIAQLLVSGPNFGGLSGVVYGLLGFYWILGWLRPQWGFTLNKGIIGFMLVWLALGYTDLLFVNMANTAHTVGLLSGMAMAALFAQIGKR